MPPRVRRIRRRRRISENRKFLKQFNIVAVSSAAQSSCGIFSLRFSEKCDSIAPSRLGQRGTDASSRTLSAGCDGRAGVARRATLIRTAKVCGPGLPTLRPSSRDDDLAGDGSKKARFPGRARYKPLKPSRRECRMIRLDLWVLPPATFFAGGPWVAASTRHSLRPLFSEGG